MDNKWVLIAGFLLGAALPVFSGTEAPPDRVIETLRARLPASWTLTLEPGRLVLEGTEPCWVLYGNRINAPFSPETPVVRRQRFRREGKQTRPRLTLRLEPRWAQARRAETEAANTRIQQEVGRLPQTLGIAGLRNAFLSSKGDETFTAKVPGDEARIEKYRAARKALESGIKNLPEFETEHWSLFSESREGVEDEFHEVDPPEASQGAYAVLHLLEELAGSRK